MSSTAPLNCGDAGCLTQCHRSSVSVSCHFFVCPARSPSRCSRRCNPSKRSPVPFVTVTTAPSISRSPLERYTSNGSNTVWHRGIKRSHLSTFSSYEIASSCSFTLQSTPTASTPSKMCYASSRRGFPPSSSIVRPGLAVWCGRVWGCEGSRRDALRDAIAGTQEFVDQVEQLSDAHELVLAALVTRRAQGAT